MTNICASGVGLRGHPVEKVFTILIGQRYVSITEFENKKVDDLLLVAERNAWELGYITEDEKIMGLNLVSSDRMFGFFDIKCTVGKLHEMLSKQEGLELVAIVGARNQTRIPMGRALNTFGQAGAHVEVEEGTPPGVAVNIVDRNESYYYEMQSLERNVAEDPASDHEDSDSVDTLERNGFIPLDMPVGVEVESSMNAHAAEDCAFNHVDSDSMDSLGRNASIPVGGESDSSMDAHAAEDPASNQADSDSMDSDALEEAGSDELDSSGAEEPAEVNVVDEYTVPRKNPHLPELTLRIEDIQPYFHLMGLKAARELKVSYNVLQETMRHLGFRKWPGAKVRVMTKTIEVLERAFAHSKYEISLRRKIMRALTSLKKKEAMLQYGTPAQVREILAPKSLVSKKIYILINKKLSRLGLGKDGYPLSGPSVRNQARRRGRSFATDSEQSE